MDNVNVIISESNDNVVAMPVSLVSPPNSNHGIDLGGFDLDEALAVVAGESRPLFAASKSFVSKLPAVEAEEMRENDVCSVCMEGFQGEQDSGGGNKRVPCGHVYHSECITLWLSHCDSCPLCRRRIFLHYHCN